MLSFPKEIGTSYCNTSASPFIKNIKHSTVQHSTAQHSKASPPPSDKPAKLNLIIGTALVSQREPHVQLWIHLFAIYFMTNTRSAPNVMVHESVVWRTPCWVTEKKQKHDGIAPTSNGSLGMLGELMLWANPGKIARKVKRNKNGFTAMRFQGWK